jgi:hypothetical protein
MRKFTIITNLHHNLSRISIVIILLSLGMQALVGSFFIGATSFELREQGDSEEYINLADNILHGNGYSIMTEEPYAPHASRTPGTLIVNVPFRLLFADSDVLASIVAKLLLALVAFLVAKLSGHFSGVNPYLVAAVVTLIPSISFYGVNPYSTGLPYAIALALLFVGCSLVFESIWYGAIVICIGSAYVIGVRPAAIFPLMIISIVAIILAVFYWSNYILRLRLLTITIAVLVGFLSIYLGWSYRNLQTFGQYLRQNRT